MTFPFTPPVGNMKTGYQISRSLRFRNSAGAYLSRTLASTGNQQKWTFSTWVKPAAFGAKQHLYTAYTSVTNYGIIGYSSSGFSSTTDTLKFVVVVSNVVVLSLETTAVYRDPSAWYHVVVQLDTTQATAANRAILYVNGQQVTSLITATYPAQNTSVGLFNTTGVAQQIGVLASGTYGYFDGYLAEVNFIDGQALTPSSFGENDATTGVWKPKAYTGTYGTNGFYLKFADNSAATAAAIGKDSSGNGNNWTPNNISVTAGVTYDSMIDTPTPYDDGGNGVGNYAVINPLRNPNGATIANGNLSITTPSSGSWRFVPATMSQSKGKQYIEIYNTVVTATYCAFFICTQAQYESANGAYPSSYTTGYSTQSGDTTGVIYQYAIDYDAGKIWIGKNNTWLSGGDPATGTTPSATFTANTPLFLYIGCYDTSVGYPNFGQRPYNYTPPSGYAKGTCSQNLPTPTIAAGNAHMDTSLWTGTGSATTIPLGSFSPDLVWWKCRSVAEDHHLIDTVRGKNGGTYYASLSSNLTAAEDNTSSGDIVTNISSSGLTVANLGGTPNVSTRTYVGWSWKANGSGSSNTSGSITSTVSANVTAGFSVVTYTGNGSASATCGHGLGVTPSMVIWKSRTTVDTWIVYHGALTTSQYLVLASTAAAASVAGLFTGISSTLLPLNNVSAAINASGTNYVAYCFAAVSGYSAFGSYTGNGSADGPFVFTGFRPRYVIIKCTNAAGTGWYIYDTARNTYNALDLYLRPEVSDAEGTLATMDTLSNGFKLRSSNSQFNGSGNTYLYAAFCENPFKYSLAR